MFQWENAHNISNISNKISNNISDNIRNNTSNNVLRCFRSLLAKTFRNLIFLYF